MERKLTEEFYLEAIRISRLRLATVMSAFVYTTKKFIENIKVNVGRMKVLTHKEAPLIPEKPVSVLIMGEFDWF